MNASAGGCSDTTMSELIRKRRQSAGAMGQKRTLWICSGWFQNKLIGWKNHYESR